MNLSGTQLKDTYGNLVTTGTTAGSPTTGGLQNGDGQLLTQVGIGTNSFVANTPLTLQAPSGYTDTLWLKSVGTNIDSRINIGPTGTGNAQINNATGTNLEFQISGDEKLRIEADGDIAFYDDANNQGLFWDASTARLGLGTDSPGTVLDIHGTGNVLHVGTGTNVAQYMSFRGSGGSGAYIGYDGTGMLLQAGDGKKFRIKGGNATFNSGSTGLQIDTSGNVGVGVTPDHPFHVRGASTANTDVTYAKFDAGATSQPSLSIGGNNKSSSGDRYAWIQAEQSDGTPDQYLVLNKDGGNVGVAVTSPSAKFHTAGTGLQGVQGWFGNGFINSANYHYDFARVGFSTEATDGTDTGAGFHFNTRNSGNTNWLHGYIYQPQDGGIAFGTGGAGSTQASERLRIDSSGDIQFAGANSNTTVLSLNTTSGSDTKQLSLAGGGADSDGRGARFRLYGNNHASLAGDADLSTGNVSGAQMDIRAKDKITLHTNSNPNVTIDSSGNVLVGKTTDDNSIAGTTISNIGIVKVTRSDFTLLLNRLSTDGDIAQFRKDGTTVGSIGTNTISSNSRFRIGSGDVHLMFRPDIESIQPANDSGIRNNAIDLGNSASKFKDLYLGGGAYIDTNARIGTIDNTTASAFKISNNAGSGNYTYGMTIEDDSTNTGFILFAQADGTAVGSITRSGTSTTYSTSSDYRLKENVVEMTGALDRVDQLKPSRFNFIADANTTVDGFLAHEVANVVPEAITGEKDAVDEEGNPIYQGIDQSKLVPLLVGAIQELRAEIEQLKNQ